MAAHILAVKNRIFGHDLVVVIGCDVCGWNDAMNPCYEQQVLASTAECPGTSDPIVALKALLAAAAEHSTLISLWDNCSSWQEAVCGPLRMSKDLDSWPPDSPPRLPPKPIEILGPIEAIKLEERGAWTVWTTTSIYSSRHSWQDYVLRQPPDNAFRPT